VKVAVIGSRNYPGLHLVAEHIAALSDGDGIITGDAVGMDSAAYAAAQARQLQTHVYAAELQRHGRKLDQSALSRSSTRQTNSSLSGMDNPKAPRTASVSPERRASSLPSFLLMKSKRTPSFQLTPCAYSHAIITSIHTNRFGR
jgi:hypothetical protein